MKYVWVMGPSGVGKKTFLQRLGQDAQLRARLDIPDEFVLVGPGFGGQHEAATYATFLASVTAPAVIIKWQSASDEELERLQRLRPDDEHWMVFLQRPAVENHRDLKARSPESRETLEGVAAFGVNTLKKCRGRANRGFKLVVLDAQEFRYIPLP